MNQVYIFSFTSLEYQYRDTQSVDTKLDYCDVSFDCQSTFQNCPKSLVSFPRVTSYDV